MAPDPNDPTDPAAGPASGAPNTATSGRSRRPAPTIDLKATEVESRPVAWAVDEDPAAAPKDETPAADETTAAEPPPPPPPPPNDSEPPRRAGSPAWQPVAAGFAAGLGGALLVVLAALWGGLLGSAPPPDGTTAAATERLARLEARLNAIPPAPPGIDPARIDALTARLAKAEAALADVRTASPGPALGDRLAAAEDSLKALTQAVADVNRRDSEIAAAQREVRERIDAHSSALADLARQAVQSGGVERSEMETLLGRVAAVEAAGRELKAEIARSSDRPARLAIAAAGLRAAVERGSGYAAELAAVKALGAPAAALSPLEGFAQSGLPSPAALARELSALAPEMTRLAGATAGDGGFLDKLQANVERLVRVRPVGEPVGDDPRALITRAEQRAPSDPAAALAELAKLPPAIRAPAAAWAAKVEARNAALDAARRVAADAAAALGKVTP